MWGGFSYWAWKMVKRYRSNQLFFFLNWKELQTNKNTEVVNLKVKPVKLFFPLPVIPSVSWHSVPELSLLSSCTSVSHCCATLWWTRVPRFLFWLQQKPASCSCKYLSNQRSANTVVFCCQKIVPVKCRTSSCLTHVCSKELTSSAEELLRQAGKWVDELTDKLPRSALVFFAG